MVIKGFDVIYYDVHTYPYDIIANHRPPTVRNGRISYYNIPCAYDIETTTIENKDVPADSISFAYHHQFCLLDIYADKPTAYVCFWRNWNEFQEFFARLCYALDCSDYLKLVVYVHNLGYEFQFMKQYIEAGYKIFAKGSHKPLKIDNGPVEWRCSYFLSNMSLEKFCENEGVEHGKVVGRYDYSLIRTPKTPLKPIEQFYCWSDVVGLCEAIASRMKEDNLARIPLTSTGYVRRDCRNAMKKNPALRELFLDTALTLEQYQLAKRAFRGGNTHANRAYVDKVLLGAGSYDLSSSYPGAMFLDYYPMSKFIDIVPQNIGEFIHLNAKYCVISDVTFFDLQLKDDITVPYIPLGLCREHSQVKLDNGRLLSARLATIALTEIDWNIIERQYTYRGFTVNECMYAERGQLPVELLEVVRDYFYGKTTLKGIPEKVYEYLKSKNKINAIFGMIVTDILQSNVIYTQDGTWKETRDETQEALDKYYNSRNHFLPYQWGVYITANARLRLQRMIDIIGRDLIYVDTDSIKFVGNHDKDFEDMNDYIIQKIHNLPPERRPMIIFKDKPVFMGIWDKEDGYIAFKTLGAKRYCYKQKDGFHITVAGMHKKLGAKAVGNFYNFRPFMTYENVGRTVSYYHEDIPHDIKVKDYRGIEDTFNIASGISILDTTYTMGITDEYWELLNLSKKDVDILKDICYL